MTIVKKIREPTIRERRIFRSPLLRDTRRIIKWTSAVLYKLLNLHRKVYDAGRRRATGRRIEFTLPPSQLTLRREFEITSKVETRLKAILQGRSGIIRFRYVILSNDVLFRATIVSLTKISSCIFLFFSIVFFFLIKILIDQLHIKYRNNSKILFENF